MSPIRKPIKIEVIDEDEIGHSARPKKKLAPNKPARVEETPIKRSPRARAIEAEALDAEAVSAVSSRKKLVTDAIDKEEIGTSFEEKLRKELESAPLSKRVSAKRRLEIEEEEDDEEIDEPEAEEESLYEEDEDPRIIKPAKKFRPAFSRKAMSVDEDEALVLSQNKEKSQRSVGTYRRIAYFFVFLVLILATAIAYFLLGKVTITLVPNQEKLSSNLIFDVADASADIDSNASITSGADTLIASGSDAEALAAPVGSSVKGVVKKITIEDEKKYPATGSEVIGKEAIGKVTIINSYNKNQMLVATTRLLAATGEMFRLKNTVNAPAGGEIEAEIYADEPSPEMAIGPTKFTIPGLWAGLQDKIYAQSKEAVVYQQKTKKHIVEEDIDNATRDMKQQLLSKAKVEAKKAYSEYDEIIYDIDEQTIKSTIDAEVGDEVDEATIKMSAAVIIIAFNSASATALAEQKFIASLDGNKEMIGFDKESVIYSLNNYNENEGKATINATFEGKVTLKDGEAAIDKKKILRLSKSQLETYLGDIPDISGFDVKFYPDFLPEALKKVPSLPERIFIEVKD